MFKVVSDQLKVAHGWVRCGHCGQVFDASLYLMRGEAGGLASTTDTNDELDGQAAARQEAPALQSSSGAADDLTANGIHGVAGTPSLTPEPLEPLEPVREAPAKEGEAWTDPVEVAAAPQFLPPEAEEIPLPVDGLPANASSEPQERQDTVFTANVNASDFKQTDTEPVDFPAAEPEVPLSPAGPPEATPEVSFVRQARRREFWKSPLVRALLGLICLLLLAALALQWMVRQKDVLAAQQPQLAPLLQALCRPLGCQIRPLRRIESLVIDSSNFSKPGPDSYRLTFVFKNTGAVALEIPALEVTLTDSRDQVLVRRVVMPAQFGATAVTLGAYSELAGAVSLKVSSEDAQGGALPAQAGPLPVVGYRILAFYP